MKKVLATILAFSLVFLPVAARAGDWLDSWFDQYTASGPDYFQGQKRGYVTAGTFSARWSSGQSYPVSIALPRFQVGCGGIDAFLGGMSFAMLPEYIVQKLQALIAAAPAIAFEVALSILSDKLSDKVDIVQKVIDALNHIQIDECRIQKGIVVAAKDLVHGKTAAEAWADFKQTSGLDDLWHQIVKDIKNKPVDSDKVQQMTRGCPSDVREMVGSNSLLEWAMSKIGLPISGGLADYVRGFVGDVQGKDGKFVWVEPCPQVDLQNEIDSLIGDQRWVKTRDGRCIATTSPIVIGGRSYRSILEWATSSLDELARSLKEKKPLTDSAQLFVKIIPEPVYAAVKAGILSGDYKATSAFYARLAAASVAFRILQAVQGAGLNAIATAQRVIQSQAADKEDCKTEMLQSIVHACDLFFQRASIAVERAKLSYLGELQEVVSNLNYAQNVQLLLDRIRQTAAQSAKGNES